MVKPTHRFKSAAVLAVLIIWIGFGLAAIGAPSPMPAPALAQAAGCPGSDRGPRDISSRTAAKTVICLVNKARARRGIGRVGSQKNLAAAARRHSEVMQRTDCFDHRCPGEPDLVGRVSKAKYIPCGCRWGVAENIAWGPGGKGSPRKIFKAWMNSSSHKARILDGSYHHVGVGVRWGSPYQRGSSAGTYTIDFGYRR